MAAVLFAAAGTLDYIEAWIFLAVFAVTGLGSCLYLLKTDPELLERRVKAGPAAETEPVQKIVMSITSIGFIALLAVSAFDYRAHWSEVPFALALFGDALIVAGFTFVCFVFRENSFTSATIEVSPGQRVVTTGPYALVRHPMYLGGLVYLVGIPIALASWWGLAVLLLIFPALVWRALDEEAFLAKNLAGYAEYRDRVNFRLVPFVW